MARCVSYLEIVLPYPWDLEIRGDFSCCILNNIVEQIGAYHAEEYDISEEYELSIVSRSSLFTSTLDSE